MPDPYQNARAYYDVTYPSSGDSFSIPALKNALQGLGFMDMIPLQPRAHSPADTKIMIRGRDAGGYFNPVYAGDSNSRIFFMSGDSPAFATPASLPRIDIVYITPSGDVKIQQGTEAAIPSLPSLAPSGDTRLPVCAVYNRPSQSRIVNYETKDSSTGDGYIFQDLRPFLKFPSTPASQAASTSPSQANNLIINGNFDIWQRGTSLITAGSGTYIADRWMISYAGTVRGDMTQDTSVPGAGTLAIFSNYSLKFNVTTADASISATDANTISQQIEGYNFLQIAQKAFTVSFWVKSNLTGTYCFSVSNGAADRSYVAEYTINSANTWEKKTITVLASPSAGTWNYTNSIGLYVKFCLSAGSNYQTTPGSWQVGSFLATANQVNHSASINNNFFLSQVQVEVGTTANSFAVRTIQQELLLCQRYYWKTFTLTLAPAQNTANRLSSIQYACASAGIVNQGCEIRFPVSMRTTPTITFYNPSAANTNWRNASSAADSGASSTDALGSEGCFAINAQAVGDLAGNIMSIHATAEAEL